MNRRGSWWLLGLLAVGLTGNFGCMCYLHPIEPLPPEYIQPCHAIRKQARDHVYIFLIHGLDPFDYANLEGLCDFIHELGYNKTYYCQLYHTLYVASEVRKVYHDDPDARIVLVGFSFGTNMVRFVANWVKEENIKIASLIYFGANTLHNNEFDQPENVEHITNVLAYGFIWNGDQMDRAENLRAPGCWHFGSPTHPNSLKALSRELARVASTVPVHEEAPELPPVEEAPRPRRLPPPQPEQAPAPRRLPAPEEAPAPRQLPSSQQSAQRDEWDFLKPVSTLQQHTVMPLPEGTRLPPYQPH